MFAGIPEDPAVGAKLRVVGHEVVDRQFTHLGHHDVRVLGSGRLDRLQIVIDDAVGARLDLRRHALHALKEPFRERAGFVILVPIEGLGDGDPLRRLEAYSVNCIDRRHQRGETLASCLDAEFLALLDDSAEVGAGFDKADDLGL